VNESLQPDELVALIERVFQPRAQDRALAILVDLPDAVIPDTPAWKARRTMAASWARCLAQRSDKLGLVTHLVLYRNVHTNNGELPPTAWLVEPSNEGALSDTVETVDAAASKPFAEILAEHQIIIAPTQFSATAPLKLAAKTLGFRAATMPGFSEDMIPALRLDYVEINRRVNLLKVLLDRAVEARCAFVVDGEHAHDLRLDLRFREAHASGGMLPNPGVAGNLPSGETYIVPYEGERDGVPSRSEGTLPVELDGAVVLYRVENNVAVRVENKASSAIAAAESARLAREPAYGNIAELGLGVLAAFGVEPTGEVLLDEKLGLHIAFGRSDHFGGQVGPSRFSSPDAVVHIDRVYVPRLQPRVAVRAVDLILDDGSTRELMRDGDYAVDFGASW
jgi:hypothetical protein